MRYAKLHLMSPQEYAKFLAGHVIGIPLALARLIFGYVLCILDWDTQEAECGEELWMYKMYVILAMLTFIPVVNTKVFGLYSIMLTVLGIFTLLKYKGCSNWHLFVEVDMFVGIVGATVVYIVWVFILDHPAMRPVESQMESSRGGSRNRYSSNSDMGETGRSKPQKDYGPGYGVDRNIEEGDNFYKEDTPGRGSPGQGRDIEASSSERGPAARKDNRSSGVSNRGSSLPPSTSRGSKLNFASGISGPAMAREPVGNHNLETVLDAAPRRRQPGQYMPAGQPMQIGPHS